MSWNTSTTFAVTDHAGGEWSYTEWRHVSTSSNEYTIQAYYLSGPYYIGNTQIVLYLDGSQWKVKDQATVGANPNYFQVGSTYDSNRSTEINVTNSTIVSFGNSTTKYGQFTVSGLSGTTAISGSLIKVVISGETYVTYVVDSTSPSSSVGSGFYNIKAAYTNSNTSVDLFSGGLTHTAGSVTSATFVPTVTGTFELYNTGTSMNNYLETIMGTVVVAIVAPPPPPSSSKKVHANFW